MKKIWNFFKSTIKWIWIILFDNWIFIILFRLLKFKIFRWIVGVPILLIVLFISYIWLTTETKEPINLSVVYSDSNETEKFMKGFSGLNREIDHITLTHQRYREKFKINYDANISELEKEMIELDKNKTTYETVLFEGDLNNSLKTFHRCWILQTIRKDENSSKILFYDVNTTFPIHIYKQKNQKWATIKTEILDKKTKEWNYKDEKYEEEKCKSEQQKYQNLQQ